MREIKEQFEREIYKDDEAIENAIKTEPRVTDVGYTVDDFVIDSNGYPTQELIGEE